MRRLGVAGVLIITFLAGCFSDSDSASAPGDGTVIVKFEGARRDYPKGGAVRLCVADVCSRHHDPAGIEQLKGTAEKPEATVPVSLQLYDVADQLVSQDRVGVSFRNAGKERLARVTYFARSGVLADRAKRDLIEVADRSASPGAVDFWNGERGLVGTGTLAHPSGPGTFSRGSVLVTGDGGNQFATALKTRRPVYWVDTAGISDAWADQSSGGESHRVIHSDDGGKTWERLPASSPWAPSFATPKVGLALMGPDGTYPSQRRGVVYTGDGGKTWDDRLSPCDGPDQSLSVSMPAVDAAWAMCVEPIGGNTETRSFYFSTDTGRTWSQRSSPGGVIGASAIDFSPGGFGLVSGFGSQRTTDGGVVWRTLGSGLVRGGVVAASTLASNQAYAVTSGDPAKLVHSVDGGSSWQPQHTWPAERF